MSDETRRVIDDAIQAHVSDAQDGSVLRSWFLIAASTAPEDFGTSKTWYHFLAPEEQPPHESMGLITYAATQGEPMIPEDSDD